MPILVSQALIARRHSSYGACGIPLVAQMQLSDPRAVRGSGDSSSVCDG